MRTIIGTLLVLSLPVPMLHKVIYLLETPSPNCRPIIPNSRHRSNRVLVVDHGSESRFLWLSYSIALASCRLSVIDRRMSCCRMVVVTILQKTCHNLSLITILLPSCVARGPLSHLPEVARHQCIVSETLSSQCCRYPEGHR